MAHISSIDSQTLDLPPSCIEFSPLNPEYFVVGTYHLAKQEPEPVQNEEHEIDTTADEGQPVQQRTGRIIICHLSNDKLSLIYTLPTDFAILDLHFSPWKTSPVPENLIATANSTGSLAFLQLLLEGENTPRVEQKPVCQLWDKTILVLSFSFHPSIDTLIGATLSTGEVVLCQIDLAKREITSFLTVASHSLEAWTLSFGNLPEDLFSGGDDAVLQKIAMRDMPSAHAASVGNLEEFDIPPALWQNRKIHGAGVTAIMPLTSDYYVTGSYDDNIRIIKVENRPVCLVEHNLGGGVWRLKSIPSPAPKEGQQANTQFDILASCMHAGVRIVRISLKPTPTITVLARFEEHESMNYGSDIQPTSGTARYNIVSTSFYDKRLCLWRFGSSTPTDHV
jgi:diphthamide biosynthesis protein 7